MTDKARVSSVFIRKYIFQLAVCLLTLVFLTVLSFTVSEKATESYAERERYKAAWLNETVFTTVPGYEENFYCFGGSAYAYSEDEHRINADVLMTVSGNEYKDNPLYLKHAPSDGGCAVSENLAVKYRLKTGEKLSLHVGKDEKPFDFVISEILPAESGIDGKYMHEGIIVLSENTDFISEAKKYIFISFTRDNDGEYVGLADDPARGASVVFADDIIKSAEGKLITYAVLSTLSLWIFIAVCEILVFGKMGRKYRDYSILSTYGISKRRLFGKVLFDHCIKYMLALTVSFLIWYIKLGYYRAAYTVPALTFLGIGALTVIVLTFITVMRKNRCPKIRR